MERQTGREHKKFFVEPIGRVRKNFIQIDPREPAHQELRRSYLDTRESIAGKKHVMPSKRPEFNMPEEMQRNKLREGTMYEDILARGSTYIFDRFLKRGILDDMVEHVEAQNEIIHR